MRATFHNQYNVFSSLFPFPRAPRTKVRVFLVALLALLATGGGASRANDVPLHSGIVDGSASDEWVDVLHGMMALWRRYIECTGPVAEHPVAAVIEFNNCWATNGLPDNLTDSDRKIMLWDLTALENHVLADPGYLSPDLKQQTLNTTQSIRNALVAPAPTVPGPSFYHQDVP